VNKPLYRLSAAIFLGLALASCSGAPKENASSNENVAAQASAAPAESAKATTDQAHIARGKAASMKLALKVEAVDVEKRLITLKGPQGNEGQYEVGPEVQRLAEIKAGDTIHAQYDVAAVAELREPTAEEKAAPVSAVTAGERGPADEPPAAGIGRAVKVVATVEAMDRPNQSLTVKGPQGGMVSIHVDDPTVFSQMKIGQSIVVSFAETLVLTVQPGAKKA